jgi:hypothetical protein
LATTDEVQQGMWWQYQHGVVQAVHVFASQDGRHRTTA